MLANVSRTVVAVGCYLLWAAQHVYLAVSGDAERYDRFFAAAHLRLATRTFERSVWPFPRREGEPGRGAFPGRSVSHG